MKKQTIGMVAHVDAGKTTTIEAMLYTSGMIRKAGRVDNQNTVMDYDEIEKDHGITVYAKEGHLNWKDTELYIIDTPGHVDFSAEMERTLSVLDAAVLVINGQDGVQSHTRTIWKCLEHYNVPVIIFVNKMDISYLTREELISDLKKHCSDMCIDMHGDNAEEELSMANDGILNEYMQSGTIEEKSLVDAFYSRQIFPVYFGSALKQEGIDALLDAIDRFTPERSYPASFGARVYKISTNEDGQRLTHMKITGGVLHAKDQLTENEKADQIRLYQGKNYETVSEASAGMVVAVKGLTSIESGDGLGFEKSLSKPLLNAYMKYQLFLPEHVNVLSLSETIRKLSEEDPQLDISMDDQQKHIEVSIMGRMQMEVLQKRIFDLSGIHVEFGTGTILYKETIASPVEGAGHFEPLRHYAEVHVRLEPLPEGQGIHVQSAVTTDVLNAAWQRNIISALQRKRHKGVLTGSPLTDVKIIITAGRGSKAHTSGGDFREAACRAVRQALMKADNVLLEPYYEYSLRLPSSSLSRALYDLEQRDADVSVKDLGNGEMMIEGEGPVRTLMNYQAEVTSYTKGTGFFQCALKGYKPSKAQDKIVEETGYDPEMDLRNPSGSVFCAHGAGYFVPWNEADGLMHIQLKEDGSEQASYRHETMHVSNDQLNDILSSASSNNRNLHKKKVEKTNPKKDKFKAKPNLPGLMIVDGYNMIFSWKSLQELGRENLAGARDKLIDILANYRAFTGIEMIIVFDGYKVHDNIGTVIDKGKLHIVYTREDQTADAWIEKAGYEYGSKYTLSVATSDALIQNAVFSQGALRVSARELESRIELADKIIAEETNPL